MILDPNALAQDADVLEQVEKATLRMVVQAVYDFRYEAREFFVQEPDLVADIGEDITREAMDRIGTSTIPARLFGKIDYKRARYVFHPEYSVRQALFIDSKAEKSQGAATVTIQTAQTSMRIRQFRAGIPIDEPGTLPTILRIQDDAYLVTTVFVKYNCRRIGRRFIQDARKRLHILPSQRDAAADIQPVSGEYLLARRQKRAQPGRVVSRANQPSAPQARGAMARSEYPTRPRNLIRVG